MSKPIVIYDVKEVLGDPTRVSITRDALNQLIEDSYQAGVQDGQVRTGISFSQLNYPDGVRAIDCSHVVSTKVPSSDRPDGPLYESQDEYLGKR